MTQDKKQEIYEDFYDKVNMMPSELEDWLEREESKSVGQDSGDGEAIGHKSGKRIIEIKRTKKDNLSVSDYKHMQKVNAYIARHTAQEPEGNIEGSNWRYSLMNWGYDPVKEN